VTIPNLFDVDYQNDQEQNQSLQKAANKLEAKNLKQKNADNNRIPGVPVIDDPTIAGRAIFFIPTKSTYFFTKYA